MAYIGNFDATTVAPATEMTALPTGEYLMAITDSDFRETKGGTGQYLLLVFTVLQAHAQEFVGRKVFVRLNIINSNQTAVDIAQRELSAICHAIGVLALQDSTKLHDLPMTCSVKYLPAKGEFVESNKIAGYKPASAYGKGKLPGASAPVAPRPAPAPAVAPRPVVAAAAPVAAAPAAVPGVAPWRQPVGNPAVAAASL